MPKCLIYGQRLLKLYLHFTQTKKTEVRVTLWLKFKCFQRSKTLLNDRRHLKHTGCVELFEDLMSSIDVLDADFEGQSFQEAIAIA
jgi:hypothetical protein